MRCSGKKATTATLVLVWFGRTRSRYAEPALAGALCAAWLFAFAGCDKRGELSEWRPEDHQPPPTVAPEGQGVAEETGDPTARAAAALWSMRCASCHGETGRGDGPSKPPGAALPDFGDPAFHKNHSDAELARTIANGRNLMPAFGKEFTQEGIEALVGHLRGLRAQ
jgi:mono/diheme cytochrome c family protein